MSSIHEFEINHLAEANRQWSMKYLNLQKQVDTALETIATIAKDTTDRDTYLELKDLEQALKRIEGPSHNTSCTYQFELAFLHLQDTPELRKIYWSALGQLQFDSNDQVIPPELEECPCCQKAGDI